MDIFAGSFSDNFDEVRDRSCSTKRNISRDSSMSSTKSFIVYHKKIEHNNAIVMRHSRHGQFLFSFFFRDNEEEHDIAVT